MKYYIAIDRNDVIWGTGHSKEEAIADAKNSLGRSRPRLKTLECTQEIFDDVQQNGYYHGDDDPYWFYNDSLKIAYYPQKQTRQNVFKTLP